MCKLSNIYIYILSKRNLANLIISLAIITSLFSGDTVRLLILLILTLTELRPIRKRTKITYKRRVLLYCLPFSYFILALPNNSYQIASLVIYILLPLANSIYTLARKRFLAQKIKVSTLEPVRIKGERWFNLFNHYMLLLSFTYLIVWPVIGLVLAVTIMINIISRAFTYTIKYLRRSESLDEVSLAEISRLQPDIVLFISVENKKRKYAKLLLSVWQEVLLATDLSVAIWTPQSHNFRLLKAMTDIPVMQAPSGRLGEEIIGAGDIKAILYPTNNRINFDLIANYDYIYHIHLGHGDSDKASSSRPTNAAYDYIFVAGQKAVRRFAENGVDIPEYKFKLIGRPQADYVQVAAKNKKAQTVLYAPTWHGVTEDQNYTSLWWGEEIVSKLIESGLDVVFRPHPRAIESKELKQIISNIYQILENDNDQNGSKHIFGIIPEKEWSVAECFNNSDILVADVSSVVSDFLVSEKPYILISAQYTPSQFVKNFPIAEGAYVVGKNLRGLKKVIKDVTGDDSAAGRRQRVREDYFVVKTKDTYTEMFTENIKQIISQGKKRRIQ